MQKFCKEARRELYNLPEKVTSILTCRNGVSIAHKIEPIQGRIMENLLAQTIDAMRQEDDCEADKLFKELAKDVNYYLSRPRFTHNNSIHVGITR